MLILNFMIILGIVVTFCIPKERETVVKTYGLIMAVGILLSSVLITMSSDNGSYLTSLPSFLQMGNLDGLLGGFLSLDPISIPLVILTTLIIPLCVLASFSVHYGVKNFMLLLFIAEFILVNAFMTTNLLVFYICFESILIPFFLLVGIWGSREDERVSAAYQLVIYTLMGSFLFLIALTLIYQTAGSFDYHVLKNTIFPPALEKFIFISFFIALAVKIPMFPAYIWLPKAHVEAPTAGSVLLAGILLKLGSYGIIRFLMIFEESYWYFTPMVITLSLLGIVTSLLAALRQTDLKRCIAYSSIAHLNYLNLGIFSAGNMEGLMGSYSLMIFHGIVSSGLFLCVGIIYDRYKTRNIFYMRGLVTYMPIFSVFFFILMMANIGFPGTSNFVSELLIFIAVFKSNTFAAMISTLSLFISAIAGFWLITRVMFGNYRSIYQIIKVYYPWDLRPTYAADLNLREILILVPVVILTVFFGFKPNFLIDLVEPQLFPLMYLPDILNDTYTWWDYQQDVVWDEAIRILGPGNSRRDFWEPPCFLKLLEEEDLEDLPLIQEEGVPPKEKVLLSMIQLLLDPATIKRFEETGNINNVECMYTWCCEMFGVETKETHALIVDWVTNRLMKDPNYAAVCPIDDQPLNRIREQTVWLYP